MFEEFVKELRYLRNVSRLTIESYRQGYDRFLRFSHERLTEASLKQSVVGMRSARLSPTSCNISIRAMNSYLSWLNETATLGRFESNG
jgi:site-specific recombinase XerD